MNRNDALGLVYDALETLNDELEVGHVDISPSTLLFGEGAVIDSLSLVSLIVDVEQSASAAAGHPIRLTDERALDREISPFTNPETLADYILELANEKS